MNLPAVRALTISLLINSTHHQASYVTFDRGTGTWKEQAVYVCRGMTLWRFDSQGARMVCDEVVADLIYRGGFE